MKPTARRPLVPQPELGNGRLRGTIARKIENRGFCFIKTSTNQEYFCHMSAMPPGAFAGVQEGQMVEFSEEPSEKGPRATDVTIL